MTKGIFWYLGWSLALSVVLFFPVSKLIWGFSIRRLAHKLGRPLEDNELEGQRRRANFISVIVVTIFAFLFNFNVFGVAKFL